MITIYEQNEKTFTHNGLGVLKPTSAIIEEELNGIYKLDLIHPFDQRGKWMLLEEDRIIKANNQLFRIVKKTKKLNEISVYAEHIFYDLANNFIQDTNIVDKNGFLALNQLMSKLEYSMPFTGTSDISNIASSRLVKKNALAAIMGSDDNSFINRWGGELHRDNFYFSMNERVGMDNGVVISYSKNLTGFEETTDLSNVVTRIMPIGYNGLELPNKYVDSPLIGNYPYPIIAEVKFDGVKVLKEDSKEDEEGFATEKEAYEELKRLASIQFSEGKVDIPLVNYKVDFVALEHTTEYKHLKHLTTIRIGDTVRIKHNKLGIEIEARCIKYKYDCLAKQFNGIELGNFQKTYIDATNEAVGEVSKEVEQNKEDAQAAFEKAVANATNLITNAMGGYVYKTREELYIMDNEDPNLARKVWRWNINGLGYSSTGVNGEFGLAMTMDGSIVASMITTGILNANLIKAGILESYNKRSWIDMEDGTFNFGNKITFNGSTLAITMTNGQTLEATINGINSTVSKKVENNEIISAINQSAEVIKILAPKIQLEGATTIGNNNGERIKINNADYEIIDDTNKTKAFFGLRTIAEEDSEIPRFAMGHDGIDPSKDAYLVVTAYQEGNNNPQSYPYPYVDIAYRNLLYKGEGEPYKDVSNIKMYADGKMRISPIDSLEITTNIRNGEYAGISEKLVAKFSWEGIYTPNSFSSDGIVVNEVQTTKRTVITDEDILDKINFISLRSAEERLIMDVTGIQDTQYVECDEAGKPFINQSEFIKLLVLEMQKLRDKNKTLEERLLNLEQK